MRVSITEQELAKAQGQDVTALPRPIRRTAALACQIAIQAGMVIVVCERGKIMWRAAADLQELSQDKSQDLAICLIQ